MNISSQLAMEFRGLVNDKFTEHSKDTLTQALAEIIHDTAFLLCVSEEELIKQIQDVKLQRVVRTSAPNQA